LASCVKRENLYFCAFNCFSLKVFVVNHNFSSSTTTKAYQNSDKGDEAEELSIGSRRDTAV
jgi:hypothetical protein